MKEVVVRSLKEGEERALFDFAEGLPERGSWGKKTRYLRAGYPGFLRFFKHLRSFRLKCLLVAEENRKICGFAVAVHSPRWTRELEKRYQCKIEKRAHILGIAFNDGRKDVLNKLVNRLSAYFSKEGIRSVEYPSFGNVCLTTATDVLTPENVDALMMFREAGFRISECYYSMKLDLESCLTRIEHLQDRTHFRVGDRRLELIRKNQVLGKIVWDAVENGKTSIGVFVKKAHRGKGLGTVLLTKALHHLKNEGAKLVELGVDGNNLPALKLYRQFCFEVYATYFYVVKPC